MKRRQHRRKRDEAADGEVNAAANDDQRHADGDDGDDGDLVGDVEEVFALQEVRPAVGLRLKDARSAERGEVGGEVAEHQPASARLRAGDGVELAGGRGDLECGAGVLGFSLHGGDDGRTGTRERAMECGCERVRARLVRHDDEDARGVADLSCDASGELACGVCAGGVLLGVSREAEERAEQRHHEDHAVGGEEAGERMRRRRHSTACPPSETHGARARSRAVRSWRRTSLGRARTRLSSLPRNPQARARRLGCSSPRSGAWRSTRWR
jgi:hypothetical protein